MTDDTAEAADLARLRALIAASRGGLWHGA